MLSEGVVLPYNPNMVHKKSEYRLQFLNLSNDIRAQIWRDNYMFRETQKRMNISDHYWRYQLIDDRCDCDTEIALGAGCDGPVSLLPGSNDLPLPGNVEKKSSLLQDKATQTQDMRDSGSAIERLPNGTASHISPPTAEESTSMVTAVGQDRSPPINKKDFNQSQIIERSPENYAKQRPSDKHLKSELEHGILSKLNDTEEIQPRLLKNNSCQKTIDTPLSSLIHSHLNPSPTRNVRKSYLSKLTPVFAAFGWNDSDKNLGDQKTYNMRAPVNQVHHSALLASGKRLKELELHLADQLKRKRQHESLLTFGPVNSSSIWMTEYQEKFSKGKREPSPPRSTSYKPVVWRFM